MGVYLVECTHKQFRGYCHVKIRTMCQYYITAVLLNYNVDNRNKLFIQDFKFFGLTRVADLSLQV